MSLMIDRSRVALAMKRCLLPIELGLTIGVVSCGLAGIHGYEYFFNHHYFYLGLRALAGRVCFEGIRWAVVSVCIYLGVKLCERFGDRYRASAVLLPLTIFCTYQASKFHQSIRGERLYSDFAHAFDGWNRADTLEAVSGAMPQIIVALLVLVLGLVALKLVKRGDSRREVAGAQVGLISQVGTAIQSMVVVISAVLHRVSFVFVPFVVIFVLINAVFGGLLVERSLNVRRRPNVVLIMIDTLRTDHVGCYGYTRRTTPNIDRFAASALRFEHAVSQAPRTEWSVPSFLSGTYPQTAASMLGLDTTLQEFLADQGYETGAIVSNLSMYEATNGAPHRHFGYWDAGPWKHARDISSPAVLSSALAWLSKEEARRFFLFTLFIDPHSPYIKHAQYDFDPENDGKMSDNINVTQLNNDPALPMPCDLRHMEAVYDSEIAYTDEHVGRLLGQLKKDGLYDSSLIIILADHGEEFKDHGALFHAHTLYHELLSVPLLIKLPQQRKGTVVKGCYPLVDLFPSIVDFITGDASDLGLQGTAVHLNGLREFRPDYTYSASEHKRCIQTTSYKLIVTYSDTGAVQSRELYRIGPDRSEKNNIAGQNPGIVAELTSRLSEHESSIHAAKASYANMMTPSKSQRGAADRQRLNTLGYLAN